MSVQSHSAVGTEYDGRVDTEHHTYTETKLGFKTSEFIMMLLAIAGILIAAYADGDDSFTTNDGWRYASWVAAAYIVSRGLAKLGVREPYRDR